MLQEELMDYLRYIQEIQCETEDIEVKAAMQGCPQKLYDTLSSFSNRSGGGVIIFGVDEQRGFEAVGVYDANDLQKKVVAKCNEMEPQVRPEFTILQCENGKVVVAAEIPEISQEEKPCYYKAKGIQKGSYIRVGDSDEPMTSYEIYNLTSYKKRIEEDLRVIEKASLEDLDSDLLKDYLNSMKQQKSNLSKLSDNIILEKLGIIKRTDGELKPTIAGLLCFGQWPDLVLPQLVIAATVIPGFDIGETGELGERFLDNKKIIGTIPQMIKSAVEFVTRNMKVRTVIRNDNGQRDDKLEYPIAAIREAIINALVHRDYSIMTESSYISIRMFNDRLEINNPGGLYGDLTVENINNVINPPVRNKNLVRILEEMSELENRSSGIATMIREMRELRLEPPVFKNERGNFTVVFKNHNLMTKDDQQWLTGLGVEFTENEAYSLVFIRKNGKITNGDYQKINNVNRDKALNEIKGLIWKGLIKSQGVGSGTYYVLSESMKAFEQISLDIYGEQDIKITAQDEETPPKITAQDEEIPPKITAQDNDKNAKIEKMLDYCKVARSKKEIMEHLGLTHGKHFRLQYLQPLLKSGKLAMTLPEKPTSKNQKYITK